MLLLLVTFSILEVNAVQPVIQYDSTEDAHLPTQHANKLRLEKNLVILPKVSHEVQYLSNPFRREVDTSYHNARNIKPVSEVSLESPKPTNMFVQAALQATPTPDIFSNLNLNYDVPSYSTPEDFQDSVNALTHLMLNKQVKFPGTSYGVPVTDTPEHIRHSTVNALLNMLIGLDKQKKQSNMLNQIVQFMHKKKMQQEKQTLVAQLQQQMQKEQYKPFLQNHEQAEGLVNFMQELLDPLKQQALASLPLESTAPTSASIRHNLPNFHSVQSTSTPEVDFDWIPAKPSFVHNSVPSTPATVLHPSPSVMTYKQIQQHFASPTVAPTKPTYLASASVHHSIPHSQSQSSHHSSAPQSKGKDGYVIRLGKPVLMKEDLPMSTTMPKMVHHYRQPIMPETLSKETHEHYESSYFPKHAPPPSHFLKGSSSSTSSEAEMFEPKYEHYIMKHHGHGEESKPTLVKLSEDSIHSSSKYSPKHNQFDVVKLEQEFSNGLSLHHSNKHHHMGPMGQNHAIIEALNFDDSKIGYDFVNSHNDHEHAVHTHTPSMVFNNHEFEQDFLKDFDQMHFKEESIPGYEDSKRPKKPPTRPPSQTFIVMKKVTKRS